MLASCPECKGKLSTRAASCPGCGYVPVIRVSPRKAQTSPGGESGPTRRPLLACIFVAVGIIVPGLLVFVFVRHTASQEAKRQRLERIERKIEDARRRQQEEREAQERALERKREANQEKVDEELRELLYQTWLLTGEETPEPQPYAGETKPVNPCTRCVGSGKLMALEEGCQNCGQSIEQIREGTGKPLLLPSGQVAVESGKLVTDPDGAVLHQHPDGFRFKITKLMQSTPCPGCNDTHR